MSKRSGLVEHVRLMILGGEIPPGGRVVELQLSERFNVGRQIIREVVVQLEGSGLLVANESGGMRVVTLDDDEWAATLRVRAALEALSAGLAAQRADDGLLAAEAVRSLAVLAHAADSPAPRETRRAAVIADRNFHRAVDALAANDPCHEALDRLWDRIIVATLQDAARSKQSERADREHHELLAAIASGDVEGATAIARRHVLAKLV